MNIKIDQATTDTSYHRAERRVGEAMLRGARSRCPACGEGNLYTGYLKIADHCPSCGEALHHQRADDAPPYFTMFIVGHVALGGLMTIEQMVRPPIWVQAAIWLPFVVLASLFLLPRVKGVLVGLQWALNMHGFGDATSAAVHNQGAMPPAASPIDARTPS